MDTGFRGAPVSKAVAGICAISSIAWLSGVGKPHRRLLKPVQLLTFSHTGALLFGLALLFQSRGLERRSGSSKHAVLVGLSMGLHTLQLLVAPVQLPYGPLPFIFASLTLFTLETPAMQHFSIFGFRLTEKVFAQAAGVQLLLTSPRGALLSAAAGVLLGLAYHCNAIGMRTWKVPAAVGRFLGPLLHAEANQRAVVSPQPAQGRAGGAASDAAGTSGGLAGMAQPQGTSSARVASRDAVEQLTAMGFSEAAARSALERTNNNVQEAALLL